MPIIVAAASGITLGGILGFLTAAGHTARIVARHERESWRAAARYYKRRYGRAE